MENRIRCFIRLLYFRNLTESGWNCIVLVPYRCVTPQYEFADF